MGLRAKVESSCEATPMPGRIAIYTSGCPKNQNRCCHNNGDPPLWVIRVVLEDNPPGGTARRPVKLNPPGTKKLVPTLRSSNNRIPADSNTPNASNPRMAVMNHDQQVSGMRIKV